MIGINLALRCAEDGTGDIQTECIIKMQFTFSTNESHVEVLGHNLFSKEQGCCNIIENICHFHFRRTLKFHFK